MNTKTQFVLPYSMELHQDQPPRNANAENIEDCINRNIRLGAFLAAMRDSVEPTEEIRKALSLFSNEMVVNLFKISSYKTEHKFVNSYDFISGKSSSAEYTQAAKHARLSRNFDAHMAQHAIERAEQLSGAPSIKPLSDLDLAARLNERAAPSAPVQEDKPVVAKPAP